MSVKNVLMGLYAQASDNPDIDLSDANATGNDVLVGKTFFAGNTQLKSGTMPTLGETTYSPSNEQQIIPSGRYLQGNQIIEPVTLSTKNITENGTYSASSDGVLGYDTLNVNVPSSATEPYIEETYDASGKLTNAVLHGYTKLRSFTFNNCTNLALISLPNGITNIGKSAFNNCSNLALTSLPSGIIYIESQAFNNCSKLALTSLPSGIISIEASAFGLCTKLALTSLPSGITSIGSQAFYGCTGLISITFQRKPTFISSNAFSGCTNLLTINVPWSQGAVANAPWGATESTIVYDYVGA
jgi:hypothetical protein